MVLLNTNCCAYEMMMKVDSYYYHYPLDYLMMIASSRREIIFNEYFFSINDVGKTWLYTFYLIWYFTCSLDYHMQEEQRRMTHTYWRKRFCYFQNIAHKCKTLEIIGFNKSTGKNAILSVTTFRKRMKITPAVNVEYLWRTMNQS